MCAVHGPLCSSSCLLSLSPCPCCLPAAKAAAPAQRFIVGCIKVDKVSATNADIGMFAVDPERQGGGLGKMLLQAAEVRTLSRCSLEFVWHVFKLVLLHACVESRALQIRRHDW